MALDNYVTGNRPVKGKELTVEEAKKLFVNFKVSQRKNNDSAYCYISWLLPVRNLFGGSSFGCLPFYQLYYD